MPSLIQAALLAGAISSSIAAPFTPAEFGEFVGTEPTVDSPFTGVYATEGQYKRAVFLLNDGMHQFDYQNYVTANPSSNLAKLAKSGIVYTAAKASNPSDSFPGTASVVAGASPRTHGMYWDDSYSRSLYAPNSNCQGSQGTEVDFSSGPDINKKLLTGGGGFNITKLPLALTAWGTCVPVYPYQWIKTNTIFEVARQNGLVTAYADKHLSYSFVNGPSGLGLTEGYFPELSSVAATDDAQMAWDDLHWTALNNWAKGLDAQGNKTTYGAPALMGANFQSLTNAQTFVSYTSSNSTADYSDAIASSNITKVLNHFDAQVGTLVQTLKDLSVWNETLLVIGSKQGQAPVDKSKLVSIDPQTIVDAIKVPVQYITSVDWGLIWLNDSSQAAEAKANLLAANVTSTRVTEVLAGLEIMEYGWGNPATDDRAPDLLFKGEYGVLYQTPGTADLENHGGWASDDANVNLMVTTGANLPCAGSEYYDRVDNQQIAPTLLQALGLPLWQLDGSRIEGTPSLPNVFSKVK